MNHNLNENAQLSASLIKERHAQAALYRMVAQTNNTDKHKSHWWHIFTGWRQHLNESNNQPARRTPQVATQGSTR